LGERKNELAHWGPASVNNVHVQGYRIDLDVAGIKRLEKGP
jgi:hypothetical protein